MARQFREQLEEEVQLEQARKAQRAASPPPVEPAAAAAEPRELTPEVSYAHHPQPTEHPETAGAPATDPTAARPAEAGGADERRT